MGLASGLFERQRGAWPPHAGVTRRYGGDQSGTKEYRFNSLGFRGEEFDPAAIKRIFVCGCSITFGEGLDESEVWCAKFKQRYVQFSNLVSQDVNLLNFSESGNSNDRIVSTMLPQCAALRPDLLIVQFTYLSRIEYLLGSRIFNVGTWVLDERTTEPRPPWLADLQEKSSFYYALYGDEWAFAATLKNMLLLQNFCEARGIPFLFWWILDRKEISTRCSHNLVCGAFHNLLDLNAFCDLDVKILEADKAADGRHPGPEAHQRIADVLFSAYKDQFC